MQNNSEMKSFVVDFLKKKISALYYYHNYEHTMYVVDKAIEIGRAENCSEHELELLSVAALWHDTGFITTYANHEERSCLLAKENLPRFGYTADDIEKVCGMIMATKIPQSPKNKLEEIMADADLEYLGTADAAGKAENLFKEWRHLDPNLTREKWNTLQISFLQKHHYFTKFCKDTKESQKLAYLKELSEQPT